MTLIIMRWPIFLKKGARIRRSKVSIIGHPYLPHGTSATTMVANSHICEFTHIQAHYCLYRNAWLLLGP